MNEITPTSQFYGALELAYRHFNESLFQGKLPKVIFTIHRQSNSHGYFSASRWQSTNGEMTHELSINPVHVGKSTILDMFQTLVHEQVHCWEEMFGSPGRKGYHNRAFANKMRHVGLMPSSTGKPGGLQTGQHMSDYPVQGGAFLKSCEQLVTGKSFVMPYIDRFSWQPDTEKPANDDCFYLENLRDEVRARLSAPVASLMSDLDLIKDDDGRAKLKTKYQCPGCQASVWGRGGLKLSCVNCDCEFVQK